MIEKEFDPKPIYLHKLNNILFVVSSIIFNLAVSGIYLASKHDNQVLIQFFGAIVVLLSIPFTISLTGFIKYKAKRRIIISNIIILCYLFIEVLLDYILLIPFREILAIHIPYIIVFYAAAFSMIGVSRTINKKLGLQVIATFLILIGCLIYNLI